MTVVVTSPAPNAKLSGSAKVTATYTGAKPFALATMTVDGPNQVGSADVGQPIEFTLDTTRLTDGNHTIGVSVKIRSGTRKGKPVYAWEKASVAVTVANEVVPTVFTTSLMEGSTITLPYSWTFNPGEPAVSGYFWADGALLAQVSGPGPYNLSLAAGRLAPGAHALGHAWDTPDGVHKVGPRSYSVTVAGVVEPPPPPPPDPTPTDQHTWAYWRDLPAQIFTPARKLVAATPNDLNNAVAALREGDELDVSPLTYNGEWVPHVSVPGVGAVVRFAPGVKFTGTAAKSRLPAVAVNNVNGVFFYGADVTNPAGGPGITFFGGRVGWWGFKVHDVASGGVGAFAKDIAGNRMPCVLDLKGEIINWGLDVTQDSHQDATGQETGAGLHGLYWADDFGPVSGRFILYIHDGSKGAAAEVGPGGKDTTYAILVERATFNAQRQVGGNAIQFWSYAGISPTNVRGKYIEAHDCAGRGVELDSGDPVGCVVEYGRATNMLLNPLLDNTVWKPRAGMTYLDVSPRP